MKLGAWLLAMCEPLLAKVLLAIGFQVVTIAGMDVVVGQARAALVANYQGLPADMLSLFYIAGGGLGIGMVLGAIATRLMLWQIVNTVKLLGVAS